MLNAMESISSGVTRGNVADGRSGGHRTAKVDG